MKWARHHSTHNKEHKHDNPHDHKGTKDIKGNNTLEKGPLPVDNDFKSPRHKDYVHKPSSPIYNDELLGYTATATAGATVAVGLYIAAKWVVAVFLAPLTGGASLEIAFVTP